MICYYFTCFLFIWITTKPVESLDYEGIEERFTCDQYPVYQGINENWLGSVEKWYVPLWNKVEFYHNAQQFYGEEQFSKLTTKDLERACVIYQENGTSVTFTGFDNLQFYYEAFPDPIRNGIYYWTTPTNNIHKLLKEYVATSYTTLTDNKSYVVTVCQWLNGRKGFTVTSTKSTLEASALLEIKTHLTKLGFNPEHFIEFNYQSCNSCSN